MEVALGLIFVFFLGGLICSGINEIVAWLFNLRGRNLQNGIRHLLADDQVARDFYDQPRVKALYRGRKPSYIPSGTFAVGVFDLLVPPDVDGSSPDREKVTAAIGSLQEGQLKQNLLSLWRDAQGNVDRFRSELAGWFDGAMERVAGWYRRIVHAILLGIGLAVAVALNIDTVNIAERLWQDDALRAAVVRQAEQAQEPSVDGPDFPEASKDIQAGIKGLTGLQLPVGWAEGVRPDPWTQAIAGWALAGLAFSFGAPFWFDLLNRVARLRTTGRAAPTTVETTPPGPPPRPASGRPDAALALEQGPSPADETTRPSAIPPID